MNAQKTRSLLKPGKKGGEVGKTHRRRKQAHEGEGGSKEKGRIFPRSEGENQNRKAVGCQKPGRVDNKGHGAQQSRGGRPESQGKKKGNQGGNLK